MCLGKSCNEQRNVDDCVGQRQKTKKIPSRPYFQYAVAKIQYRRQNNLAFGNSALKIWPT